LLAGTQDHEFLKAAKERGKAGATSKGNDAEAAGERVRFGETFFHADIRDGKTGESHRKEFNTEDSEGAENTAKKKQHGSEDPPLQKAITKSDEER